MRLPLSRYAAALVSAFALPACATMAQDGGSADARLTGGEWLVEDIASRGVVDDAQTTLAFGEDGRLTGDTACNRYFADYQIDGTTLQIGNAGATKRACAPAVMDQESRFLWVLGDVTSYSIDETGTLILATPSGSTITARRGASGAPRRPSTSAPMAGW